MPLKSKDIIRAVKVIKDGKEIYRIYRRNKCVAIVYSCESKEDAIKEYIKARTGAVFHNCLLFNQN